MHVVGHPRQSGTALRIFNGRAPDWGSICHQRALVDAAVAGGAARRKNEKRKAEFAVGSTVMPLRLGIERHIVASLGIPSSARSSPSQTSKSALVREAPLHALIGHRIRVNQRRQAPNAQCQPRPRHASEKICVEP